MLPLSIVGCNTLFLNKSLNIRLQCKSFYIMNSTVFLQIILVVLKEDISWLLLKHLTWTRTKKVNRSTEQNWDVLQRIYRVNKIFAWASMREYMPIEHSFQCLLEDESRAYTDLLQLSPLVSQMLLKLIIK